MKLLINVGLPRSGTTYLHGQFLRSPFRHVLNIPKTKEVNFFNVKGTVEQFKENFLRTEGHMFYIDFSPSYLVGRCLAIENIIAFPATEKKVVINLRDPVDQAYAHYLHDLKAVISRRLSGDDVYYPFFCAKSLGKYMAMRAAAVEKLVAGIGRENIFVVNFHTDLAAPEALSNRLSNFLDGADLGKFTAGRVGAGGWLPYYVYGGASGREFAFGTQSLLVPAKSLLLVNGVDSSMLWENVDEEVAAQLIFGSTSWTRELTVQQYKLVSDTFDEDWSRVLTALGEDRENYIVKPPLIARPSTLGPAVADKLSKSGSLYNRLQVLSFTSGVADAESCGCHARSPG